MMTASPENQKYKLTDDAAHILIVDDDARIRTLLATYLQTNGFRVTQADSGTSGRSRMQGLSFDLIILDVMMPGESGFEVAAGIRKTSDVPILMLTAQAEGEDRIKGLEIGVDDYMSKPFEPRELLLRIQNILRRSTNVKVQEGEVKFGPFRFDLRRNELTRDNEVIRLTDKEREVLKEFALNRGGVVAREDLAKIGGYDNERAVDVQINRLRQKIEIDPTNPIYLQTVRGKGYMLYID